MPEVEAQQRLPRAGQLERQRCEPAEQPRARAGRTRTVLETSTARLERLLRVQRTLMTRAVVAHTHRYTCLRRAQLASRLCCDVQTRAAAARRWSGRHRS